MIDEVVFTFPKIDARKDALSNQFSNEASFFLCTIEKKQDFHEQESDSFVSKRNLASLVSMQIR